MKKKHSFSINHQISVLFITLYCGIVLIAGLMLFNFIRFFIYSDSEAVKETFDYVTNDINSRLTSLNENLAWFAKNSGDSKLWTTENAYDRKLFAENIQNAVHNLVKKSSDIQAAFVIRRNSDLVIESHSIDDNAVISFIDAYYGRNQVIPGSPSLFTSGNGKNYLVLSEQVKQNNGENLGRTIGHSHILIDTESLISSLKNQGLLMLCSIVDDNFKIITSTENLGLSTLPMSILSNGWVNTLTGEKYKVANTFLPQANLYLLVFTETSETSLRLKQTVVYSLLVMLAVLGLGIGGVLVVKKSLRAPLESILDDANRIRSGEYSSRIRPTDAVEFQQISRRFNNVLDDMENRTDVLMNQQKRIYDIDILAKESQMRSLQAQINPHFLYNTLECVRSISDHNNLPEVSKIVSGMSDIYRYSANSDLYSTIEGEFKCLQAYSDVMSVRFLDRFTIVLHLDAGAKDGRIPRMVLQPLVENAINHGLSVKSGKGCVDVSCEKEGNMINFAIFDDGIGMEPEKLEELATKLNSDKTTEHNGRSIGLGNVNQRLVRAFGKASKLTIESEKKSFTRISFSIPYSLEAGL